MDPFPPTAADYAQNAADHAQEDVRALAKRVEQIERTLLAILNQLNTLRPENPTNG